MAVRDEVRTAQRALATFATAHRRACLRRDQAVAHRAEVLAAADEQVTAAQEAVDKAVAAMAHGLSAELTSTVLDLAPAEVRRAAKLHPAPETEARR